MSRAGYSRAMLYLCFTDFKQTCPMPIGHSSHPRLAAPSPIALVIPRAPAHLQDLKTPIIENENEWVVQGHTFDDYIKDLYNETSTPPVLNPMAIVATRSSLDPTMIRAAINTRDFLLKYRCACMGPVLDARCCARCIAAQACLRPYGRRGWMA